MEMVTGMTAGEEGGMAAAAATVAILETPWVSCASAAHAGIMSNYITGAAAVVVLLKSRAWAWFAGARSVYDSQTP